jgi:DNA-binding Lrp family transcriptional regulator
MDYDMKLTAFILVQNQVGNSNRIITELQRLAGIRSAHFVTGLYDVIAVAEVPDVTDLNPLINRIHGITGIGKTATCLAIDNPAIMDTSVL